MQNNVATPAVWTLERCREHGVTHASYGWSMRYAGAVWNDEQKKAYENGYYEQREKEFGIPRPKGK